MNGKSRHIQEYIKSADGQIRAAVIRTIGKDGKPKIFRRLLRHLIPLEIKSTNIDCEPLVAKNSLKAEENKDRNKESLLKNKRERRSAAVIGELKRRDQS